LQYNWTNVNFVEENKEKNLYQNTKPNSKAQPQHTNMQLTIYQTWPSITYKKKRMIALRIGLIEA